MIVLGLEGKKELHLIWTVEDVQENCPRLTIPQCEEVLEFIEYHACASEGVSWETIIIAAGELFGDSV